jgi:hypothetical protein
MIFYDSHGAAWQTCDGSDHAAEAFGPTGIARREPGAITWAEASELGLITADEQTGFHFLEQV